MLTINTNVNNLKLQRNLSSVGFGVQNAMEKMSTGYRINTAADDAAGLVISKALSVQTRGLDVANQNAQMANNVLSIADGALSQMGELTMRIRDLALQAANGGYGDIERKALEMEVKELTGNLKQIVEGTKFNEFEIFKLPVEKKGIITEEEAISKGYEIVKTAEELDTILHSPNALNNTNKKVILMADVDLSSIANWKAVGTNVNSFRGIFDGNGFTISNLKVNSAASYQGLFGYTYTAAIKNVHMENVDVTGGNYTAAGLVGNASRGSITNCSVTGKVQGKDGVGGLVGSTDGNVSNCWASVDVMGEMRAGGLAGNILNKLENCYATGNVYAGQNADINSGFGGLVGKYYNDYGIKNCYSTVQVHASIGNRGSFAGIVDNPSSLSNNYSLSQPGMDAIGNNTSAGITQETLSWFKKTSNQKSVLSEDAWDYSGSTPKLKWQKPLPSNILTFQIGTDGTKNSAITVDTGFSLGSFNASFADPDSARATIVKCDTLLKSINAKRGEIGASANIMNSIVEGNTVTNENLSASKSRIQDADMAKESANMVKNQILQNATSSLLAQSQNISGDLVLKLIGSIK